LLYSWFRPVRSLRYPASWLGCNLSGLGTLPRTDWPNAEQSHFQMGGVAPCLAPLCCGWLWRRGENDIHTHISHRPFDSTNVGGDCYVG
jgi:hypothetical protein